MEMEALMLEVEEVDDDSLARQDEPLESRVEYVKIGG